MNWVELTWPMLAAASLALGLVHALVWLREPYLRVHLAFSFAAVSVGALCLLELAALSSTSPHGLGTILRWIYVPVAIMVASLVYVVHVSFGYGSVSLAMSAVALRLAGLVLNFTTGESLAFLSVERVGHVEWWGALVSYPVGEINPWILVSQASNVLLMLYLIQTLVRGLGSRSEKRTAMLVVCGGWLLLIMLMMVSAFLTTLGLPRFPFTAMPSFIIVVLAISWQLGGDLFRSHQLETLLHDSEVQRLRTQSDLELVAAASGLGLWYWDRTRDEFVENVNNRNLLCNESDSRDAEQCLFQHVAPDEIEDTRRCFRDAIKDPAYEMEYSIITPDGAQRWIGLHGSVELGRDRQPRVVRGVTQDITQRKSEEQQLRTLLEAAPSALLLIDEKGTIRFANHEAARVFGYETAQEMAGVRVESLMPEQFRARHVGRRHEYAEDPKPRVMGQTGELFGVTRDGTEFPIEVGLNPLHLDGQLHVIAAVADLTERKRMEHEMAMEREGLAHLSRVTMLGELSGSLAHELNQPLAAILSNAQAAQRMLRRDPSDIGEVQEILADIVDNDRRAGQVISRLRGLLKKEHREHRPLNLNEVVQDSGRLMRSDLLNRRVDFRIVLAPGIPKVRGDRVQLQQVLLNLIINACDALPPEPGLRVVTVRTFRSDTGACTEVVDSGTGIPEAMLDTIFMPFETTKPSGMGMGLAVCRTIIGAHGGRIWAQNVEGSGARVCFDLPGVE